MWVLLSLVLFAFSRGKQKPKEKVPIGWEKLESILKRDLPEAVIWCLDEKYRLEWMQKIKQFLREDETDKMKYEADYLDCDNFARRLWGAFSVPGWSDIPFCWANSEVHAYNAVVTADDKKTYLVEPQSDRVFAPKEFAKEAQEILRKAPKLATINLPSREVRKRVRVAVSRAVKRTRRRSLKRYVRVLFQELQREGVGDQLENVYKTIYVKT